MTRNHDLAHRGKTFESNGNLVSKPADFISIVGGWSSRSRVSFSRPQANVIQSRFVAGITADHFCWPNAGAGNDWMRTDIFNVVRQSHIHDQLLCLANGTKVIAPARVGGTPA